MPDETQRASENHAKAETTNQSGHGTATGHSSIPNSQSRLFAFLASPRFLTSIVLLFMGGVGVLFWAYVQTSNEVTKLQIVVADRESTIRAKESLIDTLQRDVAWLTEERDTARAELTEVKAKSEHFARYVGDFLLVRRVDLWKEVPDTLALGTCGELPCHIFRVSLVRDEKGDPWAARFELKSSRFFEILGPGHGRFGMYAVNLPLEKECTIGIRIDTDRFDFTIVDDRIQSLKAEVAVTGVPAGDDVVEVFPSNCAEGEAVEPTTRPDSG